MRSALADSLGLTTLEPQTLNENVNLLGFVLIHCDPLFAERDTPMMLALTGYTLQLLLELQPAPFDPVTTKLSPCVKPEVSHFLLWDKLLKLRSSS